MHAHQHVHVDQHSGTYLRAVGCRMVQLLDQLPGQDLASFPAREGIAVMGQEEHEVLVRLPHHLHVHWRAEASQQAWDGSCGDICECEGLLLLRHSQGH